MTSHPPQALTIARRVSVALGIVSTLAGAASFTFWSLFSRDAPMIVGNMRGTALTVVILVIPLLAGSIVFSMRGSLRARFVWLGCLGYLAYNAVMFAFAVGFNSLFLAYATMLGLAFWSLVTLLAAFPLERVAATAQTIPVPAVAGFLIASMLLFASLWLQSILPAMVANTVPPVLEEMGLAQNPVWVLDFAFTFPLMILGAVWLWRRRVWGVILAGMMTIMLTLETAGVAVDQVFGNVHDPSASLDAVPVLVVLTIVGLIVSFLFLRGVRDPSAT